MLVHDNLTCVQPALQWLLTWLRAAEAAGARRGAFTGGAVTQWELENKGLKAGPGGRSSVRPARHTRPPGWPVPPQLSAI